jgi:hypothetical protein
MSPSSSQQQAGAADSSTAPPVVAPPEYETPLKERTKKPAGCTSTVHASDLEGDGGEFERAP